ncbi:hypothetical protein [Streptomyces tritici]|uniref:hypothetical protein n=1 Tax=Streptomyces tritici TaxID=2054410 RepID=UPI003AF017E5
MPDDPGLSPGPRAPRTPRGALRPLGVLGLLAAASAAAWAAVTAARRRRAGTARPLLDRVWHPQESVPLTPAEEEAFDDVVAHLTRRTKH